MNRIHITVLALAVGMAALPFAGAAQAACDVTGGTATAFKCDATGVNVRVDSGSDVILDVTDMVIEGETTPPATSPTTTTAACRRT